MPLSGIHKGALQLFGFHPCRIIGKEVLTEGSEFPVIGLKLEVTDAALLQAVDPGVGGAVKLSNGAVFRSYSPVAVRDKTFSLAVKVYKGGRMTQYLNTAVDVGDVLWWKPKHMGMSRASTGDHVGLVAMGIGITAVLPVLERELASRPTSKVTLLYANRTVRDEIWVEKLAELAAAHPDRFTYTRHLTRQPPQGDDAEQRISHDRLTPDTLAKYFKTWDPKDARFHVVGSKPQKRSVKGALKQANGGCVELLEDHWFW